MMDKLEVLQGKTPAPKLLLIVNIHSIIHHASNCWKMSEKLKSIPPLAFGRTKPEKPKPSPQLPTDFGRATLKKSKPPPQLPTDFGRATLKKSKPSPRLPTDFGLQFSQYTSK